MTTTITRTGANQDPSALFDDDRTDDAGHGPGWIYAGLGAGLLGLFATMFTQPFLDEDVKAEGVDAVVAGLDGKATLIKLGAIAGFAAVAALAVFAAGYLRHLRARAPRGGLAVPVASLGFASAIGTLVIGFGLKAMLAGGAPGGIDEGLYTTTDVSVLHLLVDQMQWLAWQGVALVMAVTALLSLRDRVVPRWFGVVSGLLTLSVVALTLGFALPYSAGVVAPPWLVLAAVTMFLQRRKERASA
jgi:hypothetical protein